MKNRVLYVLEDAGGGSTWLILAFLILKLRLSMRSTSKQAKTPEVNSWPSTLGPAPPERALAHQLPRTSTVLVGVEHK